MGSTGAQIDFQDGTGLVRFPQGQGQSICRSFADRVRKKGTAQAHVRVTCITSCLFALQRKVCVTGKINKAKMSFLSEQQRVSWSLMAKWYKINNSLKGFSSSMTSIQTTSRTELVMPCLFCLACCWNTASEPVSQSLLMPCCGSLTWHPSHTIIVIGCWACWQYASSENKSKSSWK